MRRGKTGGARAVLARLALATGSTAIVWLGLEFGAAPLLHRRFALFERAYFAEDVDHRLPPGDPERPTNSDGIRDRREAEAFREEGTNLVFLGDSFTYGQGLTVPPLVRAGGGRRRGRSGRHRCASW